MKYALFALRKTQQSIQKVLAKLLVNNCFSWKGQFEKIKSSKAHECRVAPNLFCVTD